jgi:hypothetical protein
MFIFSKFNITLATIFGFVIAIFIIRYISEKNMTINETEKQINNEKITMIKPKLKFLKKEKNIVNFLFSIQDLYKYNPQAYEELIFNLEDFYEIMQNIELLNGDIGMYYDLLIDKKRNTLNSLHSIYILSEDNVEINKKIVVSLEILEDILNKDLDKAVFIYKEYLFKNRYNVNTKIIDTSNIVAKNTFDTQILDNNNKIEHRLDGMFELY